MLTGCIVTDKIDWTQQEVPPSIVSTTPPITQIVAINVDPGTENLEEVFRVTVREPNVGDVLHVGGILWVGDSPDPAHTDVDRLPVTSSDQELVSEFRVSRRFLTPLGTCARVEMDVRDREIPDDASVVPEPARAVWWIAPRATGSTTPVDMTMCPR